MTLVVPTSTSVNDICAAALAECGAFGKNQTPSASDLLDAQARLQLMLQQWQREAMMIPTLTSYEIVSSGKQIYTVGPGGDFDTGAGSQRPTRLRSAILRQYNSGLPVDFSLDIIQSREDYNRVSLKTLYSFTQGVYYDESWPLGNAYPVPIPLNSTYSLILTFVSEMVTSFPAPTTLFQVPYEYYAAMLYNLALRMRSKFRISTFPGDELPQMAKDSKRIIKSNSVQVPQLAMPSNLLGNGFYNIFGDNTQ